MLCRSEIAAGQTGMFFATLDAAGQFHAQYLGISDAIAPASAAAIAEAAVRLGISAGSQ